jgi:hypothetical protein
MEKRDEKKIDINKENERRKRNTGRENLKKKLRNGSRKQVREKI